MFRNRERLPEFTGGRTVCNGFAAAVILSLAAPMAPGQESPALETVQRAIESGNLAEASQQLTAALRARPRDAGLVNLRGVIHAEHGEYKEARADFEEAVALAPELMPAWRNLGRSCQMFPANDPVASECAVRAWKHVLATDSRDAEARFSLGAVYERQGKYAASLSEIKKLPPEEAARAPALVLVCADLAGLERTGEAVAVARRLTAAPELSEADVSSILPVVASPDRAPVRILLLEALDGRSLASAATLRKLVSAYEDASRLTDARKLLERLAAGDPNNPQHLLELGRVAYLEHDLEGSLGYLGHARDLIPTDPQVHFLFGMILEEMKLPFEARNSLEKALALAPGNPDYSYALGMIVLRTDSAANATPLFKKYVAARPRDPRGHLALGIAYFNTSEYDPCRTEMRRILDEPNMGGMAAYFLGRVERLNQNPEGAVPALELAIRRMPSFVPAYTELAKVRLEQDRLQDARTVVNRALALDPDDFQANNILLVLYRHTGDPHRQEQTARVRALNEQRDRKRDEMERLMLRGIEVKPY